MTNGMQGQNKLFDVVATAVYVVGMAKKRKKRVADRATGDETRIGLRVSAVEKQAFVAAADKVNRTLTSWVLNLCRIEVAKKR